MPAAVEGPIREALRLADGVELVADLYRPSGSGRHPVLLMRQPYGRQIASTVTLAHPAWYAAHGYIVVVQDVRGSGDSGGDFEPLVHEAEDGAATLDWAAGLEGANGKVGLYGFSYQGMTQLLALAGATRRGGKRPDAIAPAMAAWSVRDHWAYAGDALRLAAGQGWAAQIDAMLARRRGDLDAAHALARLAQGEPWAGPVPGEPAALREHAPSSHYWRWLADDPAYWRQVSPAAALAGQPLDVPALFIGGWFDGMLEGTLAGFRAFGASGRLLVGPWLHIPWGPRHAGIDGGELAVDRLQLAFFDHVLKGRGEPEPPVRLFDLGSRQWHIMGHTMGQTVAGLGEPATALWQLASDGLAAAAASGRLVGDTEADGVDMLVHDPWRPAPAVGGHLGRPAGHADRALVDERTDVAVYTTAPLDQPLRLCGPVAVDLAVTADRPSHDLHCALSLVGADGSKRTLTTGHRRIADAAAAGPRHVPMRFVCCTAPRGTALRLSIQAAAWPAIAVNPGTGARPETAPAASAAVTTLAIHHGHARPSTLTLPVVH